MAKKSGKQKNIKKQLGALFGADDSAKPKHFTERIGLDQAALRSKAFRKMYPFNSNHVVVRGQNMHYLDEGDGEPVVMLHGNPTWSFFYRRLVGNLRGEFRCLAPDHVGCGFSDKPQKYPYTLERHIDNFSKWVDSVLPPAEWNGGKFNLIVHDWGGPIGLGYAVRNPERINRIVVMNTSVFTGGQMPKSIRLCRIPVLGEILIRGFNAFAALAARWAPKKKLHPEVRKAFLMPYNNWANRVAVYRFVKDIPLKEAMPSYKCLKEIEKKLPELLEYHPILIQWGMKDFCFTPEFLYQWRRKFPDIEFDEYEDAGHYLLEDAGSEILEKVREFLRTPMPEQPESDEDEESEGEK